MLARPCAAHAGRPQAPGDVISRVRAARVPTPPRRRRVSVLPDGLGGDAASAASSAAAAAADQLELLDFEAASASLSANATAAAAAANAAAETALTILASVARAAGTNIETVLSNGAVAAFGAFIGGALAWQLATLQAKARAEVAARAATREALNALDPEALTKVLGELPSWLAYRDFERAGWLNRVLAKAWPFLDAATSGLIVQALAPVLQATRPAFLTSLRFQRFSFGSIPARIEGVKVYNVVGEDVVEVDLEVAWKGNPDVVLFIRAAQDTVVVPVSLTELQASATVRLAFAPLLPVFPCFGAVSVSLMGRPTLSFDLRVVGGDITLLPGVSAVLKSYFRNLLAAYLVWPRKVSVAIPGTGYALAEARAAGALYVRLLGAEEGGDGDGRGGDAAAAAAASEGGSGGRTLSPEEEDDDAPLPVPVAPPPPGGRLRLGLEALVSLRALSLTDDSVLASSSSSSAPPPQTQLPSAIAFAAAAASAPGLRFPAPPEPLRSFAPPVALPVEEPSAQALHLSLVDRGADGAPVVAQADVPLALIAAIASRIAPPSSPLPRQHAGGENTAFGGGDGDAAAGGFPFGRLSAMELTVELSPPPPPVPSSGPAAGGGNGSPESSAAAAAAIEAGEAAPTQIAAKSRGLLGSIASAVGTGVWAGIKAGALGTAGAAVSSVRSIGSGGWGAVPKLPSAIASGWMAGVYGEEATAAAAAAAAAAATPRLPGAVRVGGAWVLMTADGGARVLAPAGAPHAGALRVEIRYEPNAGGGSGEAGGTARDAHGGAHLGAAFGGALVPLAAAAAAAAQAQQGGGGSGSVFGGAQAAPGGRARRREED